MFVRGWSRLKNDFTTWVNSYIGTTISVPDSGAMNKLFFAQVSCHFPTFFKTKQRYTRMVSMFLLLCLGEYLEGSQTYPLKV